MAGTAPLAGLGLRRKSPAAIFSARYSLRAAKAARWTWFPLTRRIRARCSACLCARPTRPRA